MTKSELQTGKRSWELKSMSIILGCHEVVLSRRRSSGSLETGSNKCDMPYQNPLMWKNQSNIRAVMLSYICYRDLSPNLFSEIILRYKLYKQHLCFIRTLTNTGRK